MKVVLTIVILLLTSIQQAWTKAQPGYAQQRSYSNWNRGTSHGLTYPWWYGLTNMTLNLFVDQNGDFSYDGDISNGQFKIVVKLMIAIKHLFVIDYVHGYFDGKLWGMTGNAYVEVPPHFAMCQVFPDYLNPLKGIKTDFPGITNVPSESCIFFNMSMSWARTTMRDEVSLEKSISIYTDSTPYPDTVFYLCGSPFCIEKDGLGLPVRLEFLGSPISSSQEIMHIDWSDYTAFKDHEQVY